MWVQIALKSKGLVGSNAIAADAQVKEEPRKFEKKQADTMSLFKRRRSS